MKKFRLRKGRPQICNIILISVAVVFLVGSAAIILTGYICGNHYFTKEEVLAKIKEKNPYAVGIEKSPIWNIFEPSFVTVVLRSGETEDYRVYSNINREVTVD